MKKIITFLLLITLSFTLLSCSKKKTNVDWAFCEIDKDANVDVFFVAPTVTSGEGLLEYTEKNVEIFKGAVLMEKGIYDTNARFFAPLYHQALLNDYSIGGDKLNNDLDKAYSDLKKSFTYYMEKINKGNKIILAGFSQGADMCLRILEDNIDKNSFYKKFIACYAIGWIVTDNYLAQSDRLKMAEAEDDQKVIISFNTEAESVTSSFIVGENEYSNCTNPLSWTRNSDVAAKDLNKGAVFLNTRGSVIRTVDNFTGCYIDSTRGVLKVTDVDMASYPSVLAFAGEGVYHIYDYQFFYNNLKENVIKRIGE